MTKMFPFTRPTIDEETIQSVVEVLRSGWLASGPKVAALEAELSRYLGGRPVRTQTSATAGMEMALRACGIGPGDEVITPALSFVATANVICRVGAHPVFVDVELDSRNIDIVVQSSGANAVIGNENRGGITPTTWNFCPPSVNDRPMILGSPPNCRCHKA